MDLNKLSAARINEIRVDLGLASENVAKERGIAKVNYSRLENGKVDISLNRLDALSGFLNCLCNPFFLSVIRQRFKLLMVKIYLMHKVATTTPYQHWLKYYKTR